MYYQYSPLQEEHHIAHTAGRLSDEVDSAFCGGKNQCRNQLSGIFCIAGVALLMTVLFLYIQCISIPSDESIMNSNQNNFSKAYNIKDNQKRRDDINKLYLPLGIAGGIATLISVFICYFREKK
jgi:hypothetical protein